VVVAGLPTKGEPLCDPLLNAIQPRLIVIADPESMPESRVAPLRQRLGARNIRVVFTSATGAVTLIARHGEWSANAMNGLHFESKK
jgi:beta-lactamase superfamily II metal-dependent hydrolase